MDITQALAELKSITDQISAEENTKLTDILLKLSSTSYAKGIDDGVTIHKNIEDVFKN